MDEIDLSFLTLQNVGIAALTVYGIYLIQTIARMIFSRAPPVWFSFVPILGTLVSFGKNPVDFLVQGRKKYGDIFTANILGKKMTFMTHPRMHRDFFMRKDSDLSPREVYKFVIPVFGRGIVYDAEPHIMSQQLKFVASGLTKDNFTAFVPVFEEEARLFFEKKFAKGTQFEMFQCLSELTILTASRCLLGREVRENINENKFADLYHTLEEGLNPLTFFLPWIPSPSAKARDAARAQIVNIFTDVIRKRRAEDSSHHDLLDVLVHATYDHGMQLSEEEISGMLLATLFAGQHTSSITSTWTLALILSNKKVMDTVMDEQLQKTSNYDDPLSFEVVSSMKFLENCMMEALRMFPPLIMLMRQTKVPMEIDNYEIPVGTTLVVSPSASMRCPDVFPNPDTFNPWRYDDWKEPFENSYIAFGGGLHRCLGERFAYLQVRTILSVLFRYYDVKLISDFPTINYDSMVAGPRPPVMCEVKRKPNA